MFLGQIFAKNAKNDPKTLFETSKSVKKIKLEKSRSSPEMTWKVPFLYMFYVISKPFFKVSTWNFVHIFISHFPLTYCTVIWKFWFWGEILEKNIIFRFLIFFYIWKFLESNFVALLILRHIT